MAHNRFFILPVSRRKGRLAWSLLFACLFLSLAAADRLVAKGAPQQLEIDYRDRLLSISARNVDIKDFFAELSEKANITIEYPVSLEKRITLELENITLKKFLQNLLRNMNYVIVYSGSDAENSRVSEVHIYPKSTAPRSFASELPGRTRGRIQQRIDSYKKNVEKLRNTLSGLGENNSRRQVYLNRIKRYEDRISNLEKQLY